MTVTLLSSVEPWSTVALPVVCFGLMNISSREMSKQKNDNECDNLWTNVTILENENGNDHENCCYYWVLI